MCVSAAYVCGTQVCCEGEHMCVYVCMCVSATCVYVGRRCVTQVTFVCVRILVGRGWVVMEVTLVCAACVCGAWVGSDGGDFCVCCVCLWGVGG